MASQSGGGVEDVSGVTGRTVRRPSENVPTNLVRVMGQTPILSVGWSLLGSGGGIWLQVQVKWRSDELLEYSGQSLASL